MGRARAGEGSGRAPLGGIREGGVEDKEVRRAGGFHVRVLSAAECRSGAYRTVVTGSDSG